MMAPPPFMRAAIAILKEKGIADICWYQTARGNIRYQIHLGPEAVPALSRPLTAAEIVRQFRPHL